MKDKIIKILLSCENLTRDDILNELKSIVKEKHDEERLEQLELERILSITKKSRFCCMPSICFKNCNDCEVHTTAQVEAHL